MPSITLRVSSDVFERLQAEARAQDLASERELGEAPVRRTTPALAAARLLEREFDRREDRARRARARRRPEA
jgi:hypothetical protein